jgi:hypothetical protein
MGVRGAAGAEDVMMPLLLLPTSVIDGLVLLSDGLLLFVR